MPLIKSLAHTCIKTNDLDKTTEFYCGALGMEKIFDFTRQGKIIGFYIKVSANTYIEVFQQNEVESGANHRSLHHFCLETEDIEHVRQTLVERGHSPGEIRMGADHSFQFWVKDPNGVDVEFHRYTDQSAQLIKRSVEVDW